MTTSLIIAIYDACDYLESKGIKPPIPRRDPREPGRREKEELDQRLARLLRRKFKQQAERIRRKLEAWFPERKAGLPIDFNIFDPDLEDDPEVVAELIRIFQESVRRGLVLFADEVPLGIDYAKVNTRLNKWVLQYTSKFMRDLDKTTLDALKQAITTFANTPGFTIGDVMNMLPFDETRAARVAVTEITRAFASTAQEAGKELKENYPDVRVVKEWNSCNDDLVCDLCAPLNGIVVEIDENFYEPENEYQDGNPPIHPNDRCWITTRTRIDSD